MGYNPENGQHFRKSPILGKRKREKKEKTIFEKKERTGRCLKTTRVDEPAPSVQSEQAEPEQCRYQSSASRVVQVEKMYIYQETDQELGISGKKVLKKDIFGSNAGHQAIIL